MKKVAVIMGSITDKETMKEAEVILQHFGVEYEVKILSAHRTPEEVHTFAKYAFMNGFRVIIAGAGGSAHLAGLTASHTPVPVLGVPIPVGHLNGLDALLSTVNMPGGVPVPTMGIGKPGAKNAGLAAVQMIAAIGDDFELWDKVNQYRLKQTEAVKNTIVEKYIKD